MEQRLTIVTLGVADVARATQFYETAFGWEKTAASNASITFFPLNGILLSLYERRALAEDATVDSAGSGFRAVTLAHNVRSAREVDETVAVLSDRGVRVVKPPAKTDWGGYGAYVADTDGHLWEIAFNPFLTLDEGGLVG